MSPARRRVTTGWSDRIQEPELRSLLNEAPIGVYRTAPDGRVLYLNQAAMRMLGYDGPPPLDGHRLEQDPYQPGYDRRAIRERLEHEGTIRGVDSQWRRKDGSVLHVRENARVVRDSQGRALYFEGTLEDVSELKETEAALRELMRRADIRSQLSRSLAECELEPARILDVTARLMAEAVGDGCVIRRVSQDGQWLEPVAIHHIDPAARELLAAAVQQTPQRADEGLAGQALRSGKPQMLPTVNAHEMRRTTPASFAPYLDQVGIHSMILTPLHVRGNTIGVLATTRDVPGTSYTAGDFALVQDLADRASVALDRAELFATLTDELQRRAIAETEVRTLATDLERRVDERTAELMEAYRELESFSYTVSHDLRAPLRAIDGFTLALMDDHAQSLNDEGRQLLGRVRAAAQRMAHLIEDLLDLSRVARADLHVQPLDLSQMAQEVVAGLRQRDPARAATVEIEPGITADGDAQMIRLVLENLLDNAWKFSSRVEEPRVEFGAARDEAGHLVYHVRDNGAGFDASQAHLLFRPFQRLHAASQFPGTGIGLATVRRIVQRHGGRVWAQGTPDGGATFQFTLGERRPE